MVAVSCCSSDVRNKQSTAYSEIIILKTPKDLQLIGWIMETKFKI